MEIDGKEYKAGRLTSRQQLHVVRRIAPIVGKLVKVSVGMTEEKLKALPDEVVLDTVFRPIVEALSEMTEKDVDYVVDLCLGACSRREGDQWAPVLHPENKRMMYDDIELPQMLQLCAMVIQGNLGRFLPGQLRV